MKTEVSTEDWQQLIMAWKRSGLSGVRFCEDNQLAYHSFVYWRKKLARQEDTQAVAASSGFLQVRCQQQTPELTLSLPNGLTIRGIQSDNLHVVRRLLDSL